MPSTQTAQFFQQYPGPFEYYLGSDGVDATFDVECMTADSHIISAHYWEEKVDAELVANCVTFALNMMSLGEDREWRTEELSSSVRQFQEAYPGPFGTIRCEGQYTAANNVICLSTRQTVIADGRRGLDKEGLTVINTVAAALNAIRQPHLLDVPLRVLDAVS